MKRDRETKGCKSHSTTVSPIEEAPERNIFKSTPCDVPTKKNPVFDEKGEAIVIKCISERAFFLFSWAGAIMGKTRWCLPLMGNL